MTGGGEEDSRNEVNRLVSDSVSEAEAAGVGGVKRRFSMLILIPQCDIRRIFRGDRRVSCSCVLEGGAWGKVWLGWEAGRRAAWDFGTGVVQSTGAASSYAFGSLFNGKSVVSVLTGWGARRPSGRCAGSEPETAASACSSSLVL